MIWSKEFSQPGAQWQTFEAQKLAHHSELSQKEAPNMSENLYKEQPNSCKHLQRTSILEAKAGGPN